VFDSSDSPVRLGRMVDCSIRIDDSSLSRYHCVLFFDQVWKLCDGDRVRSSTNGTWLFVDSFYTLTEDTLFKAGESLFKVSLSSLPT
jgi:hypothetical protein